MKGKRSRPVLSGLVIRSLTSWSALFLYTQTALVKLWSSAFSRATHYFSLFSTERDKACFRSKEVLVNISNSLESWFAWYRRRSNEILCWLVWGVLFISECIIFTLQWDTGRRSSVQTCRNFNSLWAGVFLRNSVRVESRGNDFTVSSILCNDDLSRFGAVTHFFQYPLARLSDYTTRISFVSRMSSVREGCCVCSSLLSCRSISDPPVDLCTGRLAQPKPRPMRDTYAFHWKWRSRFAGSGFVTDWYTWIGIVWNCLLRRGTTAA